MCVRGGGIVSKREGISALVNGIERHLRMRVAKVDGRAGRGRDSVSEEQNEARCLISPSKGGSAGAMMYNGDVI